MKRKIVIGLTAVLLSLSFKNEPTKPLNAEEAIKLDTPDKIDAGTPAFDGDKKLNYRWEYLNNSFNGEVLKDIANLDIQFYYYTESAQSSFKEENYAFNIVTDAPDFVRENKILENLKKANAPENSVLGVAFRYVSKNQTKYLDSDYYVPEIHSDTYTVEYVDDALYDIYAFGPGIGVGWVLNTDYKFNYDSSTLIYSLQVDIATTADQRVKLFTVDKDSVDYGSKKEYDCEIKDGAGTYIISFSHRNLPGFTYTNCVGTPNLSGSYKVEKLNTVIEEGSTVSRDNVLYGKDIIASTQMPNNLKTYTDGQTEEALGTDYQITAEGRTPNTFYLWDLGKVYSLDRFVINWEASNATNYDLFITSTLDNPTEFAYLENPENNGWELVENVECEANKNTKNVIDSKKVRGRYILIQTNDVSSLAETYGLRLQDIKAYEHIYNVSYYGAQVGTDANSNDSIRFIGKAKIEDVALFTEKVEVELSYTNGDVNYGPKSVAIDTFYKTLKTTLNGVANSKLTAEENYYFFSLTLKGVQEGTYTVSLKIDGEIISTTVYSYTDGQLQRV